MSDADCTPGREPRSVAASLHLKYTVQKYLNYWNMASTKEVDWLTELRVHVQLDTKQVISAMFFPANLLA